MAQPSRPGPASSGKVEAHVDGEQVHARLELVEDKGEDASPAHPVEDAVEQVALQAPLSPTLR